jgi:hypothetical protein
MQRKVAKIGLILLTVLLLCGLSSMEIPEFSTLTDDISNDFIFPSSSEEITSPAANAKEPEAQREKTPGTDHREYTIFMPTCISAPRVTNDLLHLFSIQRE